MPSSSDAPVTVDNCDQEPIHIPGAIQPHGVLLALEEPGLGVVQASDNTAEVLGLPLAEVLGRTLPELLDPRATEVIRTHLRARSWKRVNPIPAEVGGQRFDAIVHRSGEPNAADQLLVVELEPTALTPAGSFRDYGADTHRAMLRLQGADSLDELLREVVGGVREVTGYDRVMVYRFDEDDHGEVVAEDREPALEPFLGLHYPASDIPQQARRLYLLNPIRIIADVGYRAAALRGRAGPPLDLTWSTLRSVSPIHVEYLRNMGVAASMSVSLVQEGRLWGLIACHHYAGPRFVPYATRMTCELLGQVASTLIQSWRLRDGAGLQEEVGTRKVRLLERLTRAEYVATGLAANPDDLLGMVGAAGAAILEDGRLTTVGECPPADALRSFAAWMAQRGHEVLTSHQLTVEHPDAPALGVAGVLALGLSQGGDNAVLWFRPAVEQTVSWAGNPEKTYAEGPNGPRLTPRGSFALWQQTVRDRSPRWSAVAVAAARELRVGLVDVVLRKTLEAERSRDMLLGMVSHDLRNPLGAISMAAQVLRLGDDGEHEAVSRTTARIAASSDRMRRMIEQLLDYTRSRTGALDVRAQRFDLVTLCRHLAEEVCVAHPGFHVVLDVPESCPFVGDLDRMAQVISNLLGNARHHGDPSHPATLALRCADDAVELEVRNRGEPIPPDRLRSIFEPFKRDPSDRARRHSGLGLGLFIARKLVELHQGRIAITSDPRETVCTVWLPRVAWPVGG